MPFPALVIWGVGGLAAAYGAKKIYDKSKEYLDKQDELYEDEKDTIVRKYCSDIYHNDSSQMGMVFADKSSGSAANIFISVKIFGDNEGVNIYIVKNRNFTLKSSIGKAKIIEGFETISKRMRNSNGSRDTIHEDLIRVWATISSPKFYKMPYQQSKVRDYIEEFLEGDRHKSYLNEGRVARPYDINFTNHENITMPNGFDFEMTVLTR